MKRRGFLAGLVALLTGRFVETPRWTVQDVHDAESRMSATERLLRADENPDRRYPGLLGVVHPGRYATLSEIDKVFQRAYNAEFLRCHQDSSIMRLFE